MVILIILLVITFITLGIFIKYLFSKKILLDAFKNDNVIVFGKKRKGKDLIFNFVIHHRKEDYMGNITYGRSYTPIDLAELQLNPNTYENFINGNITKVDKLVDMESQDIYISDGGVYLPSQYDNLLHKRYPSLPIFYALSGQLYNNRVHINTQSIDRVWKALREQAGFFIKAVKTYKLPFILITRFITYDKLRSASMDLEPLELKKRLLGKKERSDISEKEFKSLYGEVKKGFIVQLKRNVLYDTRAFEKILFKGNYSNVGQTRESNWFKRLFKKIKNMFVK